MNRPQEHDVLILGAGASGMFCALTAGARGRRVALIDHGPKPGRKIRISGGGKCNLTNRDISLSDYEGENRQFPRSALDRFSPDELIFMAEQAGMVLEEREEGQIFCRRSAKDVVNMLVGKCRSTGCEFRLEEKILEVARGPSGFIVRTSKHLYQGQALVVATGGPAYPDVGASGYGYQLAAQFGHRIVPPRPALTGLNLCQGSPFLSLAGISQRVSIQMPVAGRIMPVARNLPLLFTHKGLSGPAALQASLYWREGCHLEMDFLPAVNLGDLLEAGGKTLLVNLIRTLMPERLARILIPEDLARLRLADMTRKHREQILVSIKARKLEPAGLQGFNRAEVTAGGVSTESISSKSMESALQPGLYLTGEVLDVTGRLGGYNLHWAFASGRAAGEYV